MNFRTLLVCASLLSSACGDPPTATPSATPDSAKPAASAKPGASTRPSATAPPSAPASAAPAPSGSAAPASASELDKTLAALFGSSTRAEIVGEDGAKKTKVETKDKAQISALLTAIGDTQKASGAMPKCLTPTEISFFDGDKKLGSIGLCASAGVAEANKSAGRVDLPSGVMGGVSVADLPALRKALEALKIKLP